MKYTMNDLKKNACKKARNVKFNVSEGTSFRYEKAVALKTALNEQVFNKSRADLDADIESAFENVEVRNNEQARLQMEEMKKCIKRYTDSEKRPLLKAVPGEVCVYPDVEVKVTPDYIVVTDMTDVDEKLNPEGLTKRIEIIKMRIGKPDISERAAKKDLSFHALSVYGRQFVAKGEKADIVASNYFLRKDNDRGGKTPHFDSDFFIGGKNVVSVHDTYAYGDAETKLDKEMKEKWEEFLAGKEESACSEDDCKYCKIHDLCKYKEPPVQVHIEKKATNLQAIKLSPEQKSATEYKNGIVCINAGAGAGKTTVVALRVVNLLADGVKPEKIILLTFTVPGAEEMRQRITDYVEDFGLDDVDTSKMTICTFNAFGNEIIKKEYARFGFTQVPQVVEEPERASIISDILNENPVPGLDYKNYDIEMPSCMGALGMTKRAFRIIKENGYGAGKEEELAEKLGYLANFTSGIATMEEFLRLYDKYDDLMKENNLIEFSDQEVMLMDLLADDPYYLEQFGYEHVIVDEFQDSNENQIRFLQNLAETPAFKSLMVVGDENQAIYEFRGCTPKYIRDFDDFFSKWPVDHIDILENHRSTEEIIDFANKISGLNYRKAIHPLVATREKGKPPIVRGFVSKNLEYEYIVAEIENKIKAGAKESDIAVICPKNEQLNQIGVMLTEKGITTVMLNPEPLIENSRVLAVLNFFKFWRDETNEMAAMSFINASMMGAGLEFSEAEKDQEVENLKKQIYRFKKLPLKDRIEALSELFKSIDYSDDELYQSFIDRILTKGEKMDDYAMDFLEFGKNEKRRRNHEYDGVSLTTAHSSKGLEWPIVFNSVTGYDTKDAHSGRKARDIVEEKNRLLFVSCTRARDELIVTGDYTAYGSAKEGYVYNQFLKELYDITGKEFAASTIESERMMEKERKKAAAEEKASKKK